MVSRLSPEAVLSNRLLGGVEVVGLVRWLNHKPAKERDRVGELPDRVLPSLSPGVLVYVRQEGGRSPFRAFARQLDVLGSALSAVSPATASAAAVSPATASAASSASSQVTGMVCADAPGVRDDAAAVGTCDAPQRCAWDQVTCSVEWQHLGQPPWDQRHELMPHTPTLRPFTRGRPRLAVQFPALSVGQPEPCVHAEQKGKPDRMMWAYVFILAGQSEGACHGPAI
jgi:hypothetical protein